MNKKLLIQISCSFKIFTLLLLHVSPFATAQADMAFAEEIEGSAPYAKMFTISAYYSPLPCQNRYVTGSYEGDIRLNGGGKRGADGTAVYPGMIAAPKTYAFGTKMDIPGVGIVAVHDRGGAIVASNGQEGVYDRLDIWMGYGDVGLKRALNWGKRRVEVVVHGINDQIVEQIVLPGYSPDEAKIADCSNLTDIVSEPTFNPVFETPIKSDQKTEVDSNSDKISALNDTLSKGSSGAKVAALQKELKRLNFFRIAPTGYYGEVTEHAVFKFQQSQGLVGSKSNLGAGIFGIKTRDRLNEIIVARHYTGVTVAKATEAYEDKNPTVLASETGKAL